MRSNGLPLVGFGRGAQGLKGFRLVWYGGLPQMEQEPTECRLTLRRTDFLKNILR